MKSQGYILPVSIFLTTIVLSVGLSLGTILGQGIQETSDIFFTEKSYFGAESGIEKSLLVLKKNPVENLETETNISGIKTKIKIISLVKEFENTINPEKSIKFRLKKDMDASENQKFEVTQNFKLTPSHENFIWKIICQKNETSTISIQNKWEHGIQGEYIENLSGIYDDEKGNSFEKIKVENFWKNNVPEKALPPFSNEKDKESCLFSLTNIDNKNDLLIKFSNPEGESMSPETIKIKSTGEIIGKKKTVVFDYKQSNLATFFDFGFLQQDK